jgi:XTP/dITP diphosphohydrolase
VPAPANSSASRTAPAPLTLVLASSNPGKLREYRLLMEANLADIASVPMPPSPQVSLELLPNFSSIPAYDESAPTFAENAAGKSLHYSHFSDAIVLSDDSGLVVPALGGAPGVHSARYAGPRATDEDRYRKLLAAMQHLTGDARRAYFVCVIAIARRGRAIAVVSDSAHGFIASQPRGSDGFGFDPVFYFEELGRTYAEISREEKNRFSHRGKAFHKLLAFLAS